MQTKTRNSFLGILTLLQVCHLRHARVQQLLHRLCDVFLVIRHLFARTGRRRGCIRIQVFTDQVLQRLRREHLLIGGGATTEPENTRF